MHFNILILDDEKIVCNSLKRIIENDEKKVFTSQTFSDAQKVLEENTIDLLLLDYKLGERDGLSVIKEIKELYTGIAIIMITAHGNIDVAVEAMRSGAYDYVQKKLRFPQPFLFSFSLQCPQFLQPEIPRNYPSYLC